jgi:hypothetical protein
VDWVWLAWEHVEKIAAVIALIEFFFRPIRTSAVMILQRLRKEPITAPAQPVVTPINTGGEQATTETDLENANLDIVNEPLQNVTVEPDETAVVTIRDDVLFRSRLLLADYDQGKRIAIRSPIRRNELRPATVIPALAASLWLFLAFGGQDNILAGLAGVGLVVVFFISRLDHGVVVTLNIEKCRYWVFGPFSGFGSGSWPPSVKFEITYNTGEESLVGSLMIAGVPVWIAKDKSKKLLERRVASLKAFFEEFCAKCPPKRNGWRMSWG